MIEVCHETLAPNCHEVRFGWLKLYFSYGTLVGISVGHRAALVSPSGWSSTTKKHLRRFYDRIGDPDRNVKRMSRDRLLELAEFLRDKIMTQPDEDRIDEIHAIVGFEDAADRT